MEVPQEGKYVCRLNDQMVIYEASTGSLCGAMQCVMIESGYTFKHTVTLVKADGTIQTKTTDTLKAVFDWDGLDPFWLMDNSVDGGPMRSVEFEIVGGPETGDKGGVYFKSKWLNPLGGGMRTPVAADRRSVLARYGSKFQALAGAGGRRAEVSSQRTEGGGQQPEDGGRRTEDRGRRSECGCATHSQSSSCHTATGCAGGHDGGGVGGAERGANRQAGGSD
jgi:hypothetical protein